MSAKPTPEQIQEALVKGLELMGFDIPVMVLPVEGLEEGEIDLTDEDAPEDETAAEWASRHVSGIVRSLTLLRLNAEYGGDGDTARDPALQEIVWDQADLVLSWVLTEWDDAMSFAMTWDEIREGIGEDQDWSSIYSDDEEDDDEC